MDTRNFAVSVADLERGPRQLRCELGVPWLKAVFDGTEAEPRGAGELSVTLTQSGSRVVVRGTASAPIVMPCARTLDPVELELTAEVFLLLCPATGSESVEAPGRERRSGKQPARTGLRMESTAVAARRSARSGRKDRLLSSDEAAEDTYDGETVVLDDFVRQFLLLELPAVPLRSDLHATERLAIPPSPQSGESGTTDSVDPRLRPLADIASRLLSKMKE